MLKKVGHLACRKTFRSSVGYGITVSDYKRRKLSSRDDEKDDFQNHWYFVRKCVVFFLIPVKSPILRIQKIYCFSNLLRYEDNMSTEMC